MSMENLQKFVAKGPAEPMREKKIGERSPLTPDEAAALNARKEKLKKEFRAGFDYVEALKKLEERKRLRMIEEVNEVNRQMNEELAAMTEDADEKTA